MQTRPDGRERGQVIIVSALVIAATFVGLALVLNSGIYAENLSSRETTDTEGALSFTLATDEAVAEAYERTNRDGSATADEARSTFNGTMDAWESAQQRRGATQGIGVDVSRTAHVGWRLNQSDGGQFTDDDGNGDWPLASGATDVGAFDLTVNETSLYDADNDWTNVNTSFSVLVDDGTDEWELYVFKNSSGVVVHQGTPGEHSSSSDLPAASTCAVSSSSPVVDLQAESLDGADCPALNFSDDLSGAVSVQYRNGSQAQGNYTLVVNGSDAAETPHFHEPDSGSEPTATAVVYSASYATHYGRSDLVHERSGTYVVRDETHAS